MKDITIAITAASYSGNKGAAAMLQSSISQLKEHYGERLNIYLMSVYPSEDRRQCPHDFVKILPAQPERLLFFAFPCAVFYRLLRWCPPVRKLLLKNKILKAYADTDLVVDEAGISFVDSRGLIMNTYAFACAAVPLLMGVPLVKYSQALGPFRNPYNRFLAKWILPKAELVIARGRATYENLASIGVTKNAALCADGAFTMPQDEKTEREVRIKCGRAGLEKERTVAFSISSVVEKKCRKQGVDYCRIMAEFAVYLTRRGYQVFLFPNAARMASQKPRNNDLMVGDAVYENARRMGADDGLIWERREMPPEEIRAYIGRSRFLVASRFHAMVFALTEQVPVMLIGWSHKYQEVLEQFGLGEYAADFSELRVDGLKKQFAGLEANETQIRQRIAAHFDEVRESSLGNVRHITRILDARLKTDGKKRWMNHVICLDEPDVYMGAHLACRMGYASDDAIRGQAASGGLVTAFLCNLLKNHTIDGAWVVRTAFTPEGKLTYETHIAVTPQEVREYATSVYMAIPMMAHIDQLRAFDGRLAVVLTPCMMRAFCHILEKDGALREKVVLKIGLFCSGAHAAAATELAMEKCGVPTAGARRLYYRKGHWRGTSSVVYEDGGTKEFSYTKSICAYKNAYFFINSGCLSCRDQYAECADISFGDVWLAEMKKETIKYTGCVIRDGQAFTWLARAAEQGDVCIRHMSDTQMLKSQKRALTFKYRGGRPNHRLAGRLAAWNRRFSMRRPKALKRIPLRLVYYYMCFIRVLLSW